MYQEDNTKPDFLEERWLSALTSSDLHDQLWAIQRARTAVERLRLTAQNVGVAWARAGKFVCLFPWDDGSYPLRGIGQESVVQFFCDHFNYV